MQAYQHTNLVYCLQHYTFVQAFGDEVQAAQEELTGVHDCSNKIAPPRLSAWLDPEVVSSIHRAAPIMRIEPPEPGKVLNEDDANEAS